MTEPVEAPFLLADRYLLGAELGRGGVAVVFRAWDSTSEPDRSAAAARDAATPQRPAAATLSTTKATRAATARASKAKKAAKAKKAEKG